MHHIRSMWPVLLVLLPGAPGVARAREDSLGLTRRPESQEELEQLMPPWSETTRSLAYRIRRAL